MINQLKEVYSICFDDVQQYIDYVFKYKYSEKNALYYKENGRIVSELFIVEKKLKIRDMIIPCPYIAGVCTLPEYRNKGYAQLLLNNCFKLLRDKGYFLCALHPFRHSFYQKSGFVTYNKVKLYKTQYNGTDSYALRDIKANDIKQVKCLYENFMNGYNGYVQRNLTQTLKRFKEFSAGGNCKFIVKDDDILGYVYYDNNNVEEYCAPEEILDSMKEFEEKTVYLPYQSTKGKAVDFTMLKVINKEGLVDRYKMENYLKELDDFQFVHALTGSWQDFNIKLPDLIKQKYIKMNNFVFDKY